MPPAGTRCADAHLTMDWGLVDTQRLEVMRCPSCHGVLGGGIMRQVEWSARRCVVVVVCPDCSAECMAILDARVPRLETVPPLDVEDVCRAHDLLGAREWKVNDLFAA